MDPEQNKQFSHITIGTSGVRTPVEDDEEVFAIGAVELLDSARTDTAARVSVEEDDLDAPAATTAARKDAGRTGENLAAGKLEDVPNPLARRIVMVLAALGFVLIVLYVLDYWGVITLPF